MFVFAGHCQLIVMLITCYVFGGIPTLVPAQRISNASTQVPLNPPDPEQAYVDALRDRKLYRLLERYCRGQLDREDVTGPERARYTIELANILATRAQAEPQSASRTELWQQASSLLRTFLRENEQHPQATALQFQLGVYELAQAELSRNQAKVAPQNKEL